MKAGRSISTSTLFRVIRRQPVPCVASNRLKALRLLDTIFPVAAHKVVVAFIVTFVLRMCFGRSAYSAMRQVAMLR